AIDMNQDNYLCEALKMRSLTSEFNPPRFDDLHAQAAQAVGIGRKESRASDTSEESEPAPSAAEAWEHERPFPDMAHQPVALVGFREWIFSQDSGALAGFAAATEFTFGSIVQRIMTWPGAARFHYGHPDLWNKLFVMTRGGPSKATRGFHISEDVFAGYNHTLRGGRTKFKEYVSVGKGRDMGFDSINGFEAKVSGGNGEQVMSRDVFRMSARMDFFRLMAFYHSGCGFFVNTTLLLASVYANVWVIVLISLTGSELVVDPRTLSVVSSLTGQAVGVSVNQAVQLGLFSIVTYAVELMLERGIMHMLATILVQIIQGSVAFFTFRARTTMHYFTSDVQYGGAKYVSTGRGYALKHNSFVKVYAGYARSHLYFGTELIFMLILLALINTSDYALLTWSAWLVAVCLLWAPFWFNPQTFQIERCTDDFEAWVLWMTDVVDAESGTTWFSWNKGQLERARNELGTLNNPFATTVRGLLMAVPTAVLAVAAVTTINNTEYNRWIIFGTVSGGFWFAVVAIWCLRYVMLRNYWHRLWRATRTFVAIGLIAFIVCVIIFIPGGVSAGVGVRNLVIIVFANIEIVAIVAQVLLYTCRGSLKARYITDSAYRMLDWALGYMLFGFLFLLSFLQIVDIMQGALLFNMKFAKALQRSRLLESNFFSSYVDRAMERVTKNLKEEQRLAGEPHSGRPPVSRSSSKVA
ncbi:1,3-beta-glucan synthase, partial [Helicosporidium sp. ATCC 50920]